MPPHHTDNVPWPCLACSQNPRFGSALPSPPLRSASRLAGILLHLVLLCGQATSLPLPVSCPPAASVTILTNIFFQPPSPPHLSSPRPFSACSTGASFALVIHHTHTHTHDSLSIVHLASSSLTIQTLSVPTDLSFSHQLLSSLPILHHHHRHHPLSITLPSHRHLQLTFIADIAPPSLTFSLRIQPPIWRSISPTSPLLTHLLATSPASFSSHSSLVSPPPHPSILSAVRMLRL